MDIERLLLRLKKSWVKTTGGPRSARKCNFRGVHNEPGGALVAKARLDEVRNVTQLSGHASEGLDPSTITTDFLSRLLPWCLSSFEWQEVRHEDHDSR